MLSKGEIRMTPAIGRAAASFAARLVPRLRPNATMRAAFTSGRAASASWITSASPLSATSDGLPSLAP